MLHEFARRERVPLMQAARFLVESEELKPKPRGALRNLIGDFDRWRALIDSKPQHELAEQVLDESGYTEMWRADKDAGGDEGRLDNLKELVRAMEALSRSRCLPRTCLARRGTDSAVDQERVSIMTLHGAKGLETVYLPGWEEGLFPSQRTLDEQGRAGLEEERRLAYVGLTRAKRRAKIFASNRRIHGLWQPTVPSRCIDNLPMGNVEVVEAPNASQYGSYGARLRQSRRLWLRLFDAGLEARAGVAGRCGARRTDARGARETTDDDRRRSDRALVGERAFRWARASFT
ncbi:MAG: ATP-dependent helicase [Methylocystis sp.]